MNGLCHSKRFNQKKDVIKLAQNRFFKETNVNPPGCTCFKIHIHVLARHDAWLKVSQFVLDSASIVVSTCIIITPSIFQQILYTSVGRVQKKQDDLA